MFRHQSPTSGNSTRERDPSHCLIVLLYPETLRGVKIFDAQGALKMFWSSRPQFENRTLRIFWCKKDEDGENHTQGASQCRTARDAHVQTCLEPPLQIHVPERTAWVVLSTCTHTWIRTAWWILDATPLESLYKVVTQMAVPAIQVYNNNDNVNGAESFLRLSEEIPHLLRNPKVHYRVHRSVNNIMRRTVACS